MTSTTVFVPGGHVVILSETRPTQVHFYHDKKPEVSATTKRLIDLLIARDQAGRAKYGTTLDRTDLTHEQWLQHMVEELLDGAGYALSAIRTNPESKV